MTSRQASTRPATQDVRAHLYRRLDSINVNSAERERVKDDLQAAETAVDAFLALISLVRGWLAPLRAAATRLPAR
jgi:hypothetical protein